MLLKGYCLEVSLIGSAGNIEDVAFLLPKALAEASCALCNSSFLFKILSFFLNLLEF